MSTDPKRPAPRRPHQKYRMADIRRMPRRETTLTKGLQVAEMGDNNVLEETLRQMIPDEKLPAPQSRVEPTKPVTLTPRKLPQLSATEEEIQFVRLGSLDRQLERLRSERDVVTRDIIKITKYLAGDPDPAPKALVKDVTGAATATAEAVSKFENSPKKVTKGVGVTAKTISPHLDAIANIHPHVFRRLAEQYLKIQKEKGEKLDTELARIESEFEETMRSPGSPIPNP